MKLKFVAESKLKTEILQIIGRYLNIEEYKIFFFGSRVSGKGNERSDIDIGIEGTKPISASIMARIKEEINELPMLYSIDIVDFADTDENFCQVAKRNIEIIYATKTRGSLRPNYRRYKSSIINR